MKISAANVQTSEHVGEITQPFCDQISDAIGYFPLTLDYQQVGAMQFPALPRAKIRPHDDLYDPTFILQRQECCAMSGLRPLP